MIVSTTTTTTTTTTKRNPEGFALLLLFISLRILLSSLRCTVQAVWTWLQTRILIHVHKTLKPVYVQNYIDKNDRKHFYLQAHFSSSLFLLIYVRYISMLNFSKYGEQQILGWNLSRNLWTAKTFKENYILKP